MGVSVRGRVPESKGTSGEGVDISLGVLVSLDFHWDV